MRSTMANCTTNMLLIVRKERTLKNAMITRIFPNVPKIAKMLEAVMFISIAGVE